MLHPQIQLEPASLEVLVLQTCLYLSSCNLGASLDISFPTLLYLLPELPQLWSIVFLMSIGLG